MKIIVNKKNYINEIKSDSPQYQETANITGKEKVLLDDFFEGKNRIFVPLQGEINPAPKNAKESKKMVEDIIFDSFKALSKYRDLYEDSDIEEENEKKKKLRQSPLANFIYDIKDDDDELFIKYITNRLSFLPSMYATNGLKVDYDRKLIFNLEKTKRYPLLKFMEKHKKCVETYITFFDSLRKDVNFRVDYITNREKLYNNLQLPKECKEFFNIVEDLLKPVSFSQSKLLEMFIYYKSVDGIEKSIDLFSEFMTRFGYNVVSNKYASLMMMISRVPIDIVRMSDFQSMQSCHSVNGMYASCATQEGVSLAGSISYLIKKDMSDEQLKKLETSDEEVFRDPDRDVKGIEPISRLRLRTYELVFEYSSTDTPELYYDVQPWEEGYEDLKPDTSNIKKETFYVIIPSDQCYGLTKKEYIDELYDYVREKQKDKLERIIEISKKKKFKFLSARYMGGGYFEPDGLEFEILSEYLNIENIKNLAYKTDSEYPKNYPTQQEDGNNISEVLENIKQQLEYKNNNYEHESIMNFEVTTDSGEDVLRYYSYRTGWSDPSKVKNSSEDEYVNIVLYASFHQIFHKFKEITKKRLGIKPISIVQLFHNVGAYLEDPIVLLLLKKLQEKNFNITSTGDAGISRFYILSKKNKYKFKDINERVIEEILEDFHKALDTLLDIDNYYNIDNEIDTSGNNAFLAIPYKDRLLQYHEEFQAEVEKLEKEKLEQKLDENIKNSFKRFM